LEREIVNLQRPFTQMLGEDLNPNWEALLTLA